jgi:hypothetical protein
VLDLSYPGVDGLTLGRLGTHQIGQLMSAVDQMSGQCCEKLEKTVFMWSETKTHEEAPVIGNVADTMVEPRTPQHTTGRSPPRRPDVV